MALTPTFQVGPPPKPGDMTRSNGRDVFVPNPAFYNWQRLFWQWSSTLGNNADGAAAFSGKVQIGTSPNWFVADSNGIYLGGATFAASPFRVSMAGAITGTSGTIGGWTLGSSSLSASGSSGSVTLDAGIGKLSASRTNSNIGMYCASVVGVDTAYLTLNSGASLTTRVLITTAGDAGTISLINTAGVSKIYADASTETVTATTFVGALTGTASGNLVSGGALGTPSSGTLTNCTFPTLNQNTTGSAATLTTARNIGGTSFNGSAAIDPIQTKHAGDNSICNFAGSPGATTYALAYTVGKNASGGAIPALNRNADDGGTMAWYWLKTWSGSQFVYIPYMA